MCGDLTDYKDHWAIQRSDYNTSIYEYSYHYQRAIPGKNLYKLSDKTVEECKAICDADSDCLAFEYGVYHGGQAGSYRPGDCQPQSSLSG
jgi:hypothetical protein